MRLQLTLLVVLTRTLYAAPDDDPHATGGVHVYADDDHVTVISPAASVQAGVSPRVTVAADVTVDAVSAASVDVVTSASPSTVHEQRIELGLAASYRISRASWWTLGGRGSHEHDYDALRLRVSAWTELAQRNTTLQVDYVLGQDDVTSMTDRDFHRDRTSHELMVSASQLVSRRGVVDVIADLTRASGYHASPYRHVLVDVPASPLPMRVDEVTPRIRSSVAVGVRARYAVTERWATSAMYRFYLDTWSVLSHTATAEAYYSIGGRLVGATVRGYSQDDASFYAPHYVGTERYRTRDRTLAAMRSLHAALTLEAPVADWRVLVSAGVLRLWFLDVPSQADRNALLVFTSVTRSW